MDILILDTNVLLADPQSIFDFDLLPQYQAVILKPVMEELDYLKSSEGETGYQAREASRFLEHLILTSPKSELGWQIGNTCTLILDEQTERRLSAEDRRGNYDDRILASMALYVEDVEDAEGSEKTPWLVTLDRNMRIRAEARGIPWLNPAAWIPILPNTYILPIATYGIVWKAQEGVGVRLTVNLGSLGEGWIEVWPYWGYPSGLFSTVHFRLFEPAYKSPMDQDSASPVLILSAENRIRYMQQMGNVPYKIVNASCPSTGIVYHKGYKLEVGVRRCEVGNPIRVPESAKRHALADLAYGTSRLGRTNLAESFFTGALIGQAIGTLTAEAKASPVFTRLSLVVRVSEATQEEIEKALSAETVEKETEEKKRIEKKRQNTLILVVAVVLAGVALISPFALCLLITFLSFLSSLLNR